MISLSEPFIEFHRRRLIGAAIALPKTVLVLDVTGKTALARAGASEATNKGIRVFAGRTESYIVVVQATGIVR